MKRFELEPRFMKYIPESIEEGILYISEELWVTIHLCACGCGRKVVAPLDIAVGWVLTHNEDKTVSLHPSLGNFDFPCKSHYFIKNNKVDWC